MTDSSSPIPTSPPLLRPPVLRAAAILLLLFGLQLWLTAGNGYWRNAEPKLLTALLILCCIPPLSRRLWTLLNRLRHPPRAVTLTAAAILALLSSAYILHDAIREDRPLSPRYQDEYSYRIQTQHVAHGRLWMPPHPVGEFFESFQLLSDNPVYASIYFPGTAILHAPGVWLNLPTWAMPLACAGLTLATLFLLTTYFFDAIAGLLASLMLLSLPIFRRMATKSMAQVPALLLGLIAIACYLRWRRDRKPLFAALTGFFLAFTAITRPADALCFAIPIAVAMLTDIARSPAWRPTLLRTAAFVLLGALPFLTLQAIFNHAITGHLTQTPFRYYLDRNLPGTQFGFHPIDPSARPQSDLPQKLEYYDRSTAGALQTHTPLAAARLWLTTRLPVLLTFDIPHPMLIALLPLGLLAIATRHRWLLAAVAPLFVLVYYFYPFFFPHYALLAAPALLLLILCAPSAIQNAFPRLSPAAPLFLLLSILTLTLVQFREFNRHIEVDPMRDNHLRRIDTLLSQLPGRSIVLFHYDPGGLYEQEPVYNADVAYPDDAKTIRAHDLGPTRNPKLFHYYAPLHPDRTVYLYNRTTQTLTRLGNVRDLASP